MLDYFQGLFLFAVSYLVWAFVIQNKLLDTPKIKKLQEKYTWFYFLTGGGIVFFVLIVCIVVFLIQLLFAYK